MNGGLDSQVNDVLIEVIRLAKEGSKLTGFCIGNTRKINGTGLYFSPIRISTHIVAGSAIVYSVDQAREIAKLVDGRVDYILIDTEKKISPELYGVENVGNVERAVREIVGISKILTYKGNDLTVDAIERFIVELLSTHPRGLSGKRATIIGAGNVGAKLALKLVERGMNVVLVRRDQEKLLHIVRALNIIKPAETIASVSFESNSVDAARNSDLIVGLTNGIPVITADMIDVMAANPVLLDAGKGCFHQSAIERAESSGHYIYRADVRAGFEGHVSMALEAERIVHRGLARSTIANVLIVSAGLLARKGECIVDNVHSPNSVYGIGDGLGDFVRNLTDGQVDQLNVIKNYISTRNSK